MNSLRKRLFDIILSFTGLIITLPIILIAWVIASFDTQSNGMFVQKRVGKGGKLFNILKIKTMKKVEGFHSTVTSMDDVRITKSGKIFRNYKIDELPQLWNVLIGEMSFVGPRPDVKGYADKLKEEDKLILSVRPGITGPASLKYKDEERLLLDQKDPQYYNDEVIWPNKIKINKQYIETWSFRKDLIYILKTIIG